MDQGLLATFLIKKIEASKAFGDLCVPCELVFALWDVSTPPAVVNKSDFTFLSKLATWLDDAHKELIRDYVIAKVLNVTQGDRNIGISHRLFVIRWPVASALLIPSPYISHILA